LTGLSHSISGFGKNSILTSLILTLLFFQQQLHAFCTTFIDIYICNNETLNTVLILKNFRFFHNCKLFQDDFVTRLQQSLTIQQHKNKHKCKQGTIVMLQLSSSSKGFLCYIPPYRFTALFLGPSGWAGARRELIDFMVQLNINRGRHTDHPAGRHSIRTNQCPSPPSPHFFYRSDALPAAQPTVSKHWRHCAI